MPCLDEAETLGASIKAARLGIAACGIAAEIVVADNGSADDSVAIAAALGARVVKVSERGYGNALRAGIQAAIGKWIVMGDADGSYDFSETPRFVEKLREGFDIVMGCRLPAHGGRILPGAMPWKNRWIGNPALSFIGRLFFKSPAHDFHCGLRAFTKPAYERMDLKTTGMEFASEMVIKSTLLHLRIAELPVTLRPAGRSRPPHLRAWRDGWRHLRFMLIYSPRWLFLVPGLLLFLSGIAFGIALSLGDLRVGNVTLSIGTLTISCMAIVVAFQLIAFAFFTKVFAIAEGLLPQDRKFASMFRTFTLEKGLAAGLFVLLGGALLLLRALWIWKEAGYGALSYSDNIRRVLPAATLMILGVQSVFSSFFMSVLGLKTLSRTPPQNDE